MSLSSRARNLSRLTGWTQRRSLRVLRDLGARPRELAAEYNWPLPRADAFVVDPWLDREFRSCQRSSAVPLRARCEGCAAVFFRDALETTDRCPACRGAASWECSRCGTHGGSSPADRRSAPPADVPIEDEGPGERALLTRRLALLGDDEAIGVCHACARAVGLDVTFRR